MFDCNTKKEYLNLSFGGEENTHILDKVCAVLLALTPILQHYKGVYQNAGFTVLLLILPYVLYKLIGSRINERMMAVIMPILLFQIYRMIDHTFGLSKVLYAVCIIVYILAFACGRINLRYLIKTAIYVSCLASILIIFQYIFFYLGHTHLQLVPTSLLLDRSSAWVAGAKTGLIGVNGHQNGFYRPSAFFLEPSHMMLYCFPSVMLLLLSPDTNWHRKLLAVLVSAGIILSTSGMGIAITFCTWAVYFGLYRNGKDNSNIASFRNLFSWQNAVLLVVMLAVVVVMYFKVDFVAKAVNRVFSNPNGSTAISGRVGQAKALVGDMSGFQLFIGATEDVSKIDFNLSGFYGTLYKYGIIGVVLSYFFYFIGFAKLRGGYFWINAMVVAISYFTAHTHGTFYMLFFTAILLNGFYSELHGKKSFIKNIQKKKVNEYEAV